MKKVIILISSILFSLGMFSQSANPEVMSSSGDYNENANGSLSWTLGETIIETIEGVDNKLTQGFHQSTYTVVNIYECKDNKFEISVYPNPATDFVNIKTDNVEFEDYTISVTDIEGSVLYNNKMNGNYHKVDLASLAGATFLLTIISLEGKVIQTYKIKKETIR